MRVAHGRQVVSADLGHARLSKLCRFGNFVHATAIPTYRPRQKRVRGGGVVAVPDFLVGLLNVRPLRPRSLPRLSHSRRIHGDRPRRR